MRTFWIIFAVLAAALVVLLSLTGSPEPEESKGTEARQLRVKGPELIDKESAKPQPPLPAPPIAAPLSQSKAIESVVTTATTSSFRRGLDREIKGATVRPGNIVEQNGSLIADGKFTVRGAGTKASPYEVSWDLLLSASDTFIPRLGERVIPQRIAMLDGAYIRISGFIAFPLIATETDECLVMLNQWDGCCIGVPPSPYDAIEVKLLSPSDNSKRHVMRVGSIEGVFHIDPYIVERWLVGLYTMDEAELSTEL